MNKDLRRQVMYRAMQRCEAEVERGGGQTSLWSRCTNPASDVHHMVTKARGGHHLDDVWETYHLIALCRECHDRCAGETAYEGGMLIQGHVTWDRLARRPVYNGPDEYLTQKYGLAFQATSYAQRPVV